MTHESHFILVATIELSLFALIVLVTIKVLKMSKLIKQEILRTDQILIDFYQQTSQSYLKLPKTKDQKLSQIEWLYQDAIKHLRRPEIESVLTIYPHYLQWNIDGIAKFSRLNKLISDFHKKAQTKSQASKMAA